MRRTIAAMAAVASCALAWAPATRAQDMDSLAPHSNVSLGLDYKLDLLGVAQGGLERRSGHLDALSLSADIDLDRALGWTGAAAHVELLSTNGGAPGEAAGALQGVDNIEVGARRPRLYQAWMEQSLADERANLRLGFSDLSGEFAVIDSSGLLLNPSFGMAAEFAATGAAAFPSTAVGARLRVHPTKATYAQVAVANARAGVPGDAGGADYSFDDGEVLVVEAGWTGRGKVAAGYWRLTADQSDLFDVDPAGNPIGRTAQGGYLLIEQPLNAPSPEGRAMTAFLRAGVSDGETTPFSGSWQAGILIEQVFAGRPDSALSFGVSQARLSSGYRDLSVSGGLDVTRQETVFEAAYSDLITENLRIQPDVQYVRRPAGDRGVKDAVVVGLRFNLAF